MAITTVQSWTDAHTGRELARVKITEDGEVTYSYEFYCPKCDTLLTGLDEAQGLAEKMKHDCERDKDA